MKSRYRKHIERIEKRSPILAFSKEDVFQKQDILTKEDFETFNKHEKLDRETVYAPRYRHLKQEMLTSVQMFLDNYLLCGGHEFVFLLLPTEEDRYKIVEKESLAEWAKKYWEKEDPENKRDWSYIDEDVNDLYNYMIKQFNRHNKGKKI